MGLHPVPIQKKKLHAWLALSRPPFHSVGLLPFLLGTVLAWRLTRVCRFDILAWGTMGVVLVMLATYYAGEYWDYHEDSLASRIGTSRFSAGSQVIQRGLLPRQHALWASLLSVAAAVGVGGILQAGYQTGIWTLPLGVIGLLGGFFYSSRPIRWVRSGVGELWIAFCYGWLPVATAFYLQTGYLASTINWLALPVGLTIFNVILLNELPDYDADLEAGKTNVAVRLGLKQAAALYVCVGVAGWIAVFLSLLNGVPVQGLWFYLPTFAVSIFVVAFMIRGRWKNRLALQKLCGANLLVNLGTTAAYIAAFLG
jgi:1,4-dihydroxy-2-naphthoate octaprenyltransferase